MAGAAVRFDNPGIFNSELVWVQQLMSSASKGPFPLLRENKRANCHNLKGDMCESVFGADCYMHPVSGICAPRPLDDIKAVVEAEAGDGDPATHVTLEGTELSWPWMSAEQADQEKFLDFAGNPEEIEPGKTYVVFVTNNGENQMWFEAEFLFQMWDTKSDESKVYLNRGVVWSRGDDLTPEQISWGWTEEQGHNFQPVEGSPVFYKIPPMFWVHPLVANAVVRAYLRKDPLLVLRLVPEPGKRRIGNLDGSSAVGMIHGQAPGEPVWFSPDTLAEVEDVLGGKRGIHENMLLPNMSVYHGITDQGASFMRTVGASGGKRRQRSPSPHPGPAARRVRISDPEIQDFQGFDPELQGFWLSDGAEDEDEDDIREAIEADRAMFMKNLADGNPLVFNSLRFPIGPSEIEIFLNAELARISAGGGDDVSYEETEEELREQLDDLRSKREEELARRIRSGGVDGNKAIPYYSDFVDYYPVIRLQTPAETTARQQMKHMLERNHPVLKATLRTLIRELEESAKEYHELGNGLVNPRAKPLLDEANRYRKELADSGHPYEADAVKRQRRRKTPKRRQRHRATGPRFHKR